MKMMIEIQMDNAAFEGEPLGEVARILEEQARKMRRFADQHEWNSSLHDINGNKVGRVYTVKEED